MINPSTVSIPGVSVTSGSSPGNIGLPSSTSSIWINKLKIVGNGQNWAVAPCEPFYLMGTESPTPDNNALTGAKNLIEHYGLENAYQKFCGRRVKEELSAFLPHLSGNVDVAASTDGSGLIHLIERPPIRGKDIRPFAPAHLEQAFRLHPGPLPQEYMSLFAAAPQSSSTSSSKHHFNNPVDGVTAAGQTGSTVSRIQPATTISAFSNSGYSQPPDHSHRRRRRYEIHRGLQASVTSGGTPSSLTPPSAGFLPASLSTSAGTGSNLLAQPPPQQQNFPGVTSSGRGTETPNSHPSGALSNRYTEVAPPPPGLIHISSSCGPLPSASLGLSTTANAVGGGGPQTPGCGVASTPTQHPPPPLLAPVHPHQPSHTSVSFSSAQSARLPHSTSCNDVLMCNNPVATTAMPLVGGAVCHAGLPAPPLLHSIHNLPLHYHPPTSAVGDSGGGGRDWSLLHSSPPPAIAPSCSPLDGHNPDGSLQVIPTLTVGEEERRRKRKEKRRRRDRE